MSALAELRAVRLRRKRPQGFVVVTDLPFIVRGARSRGLTVIPVDWEKAYDMRVLHNLHVLLAAMDRDRAKAAGMAMAILEAEPRSFWAQYWTEGDLWSCETEWVLRESRH